MWIYYIIGYIVIGIVVGYIGNRFWEDDFAIPTAVCVFIWPLILTLITIFAPFMFFKWLDDYSRNKYKEKKKKEEIKQEVGDYSMKSIRHFISVHGINLLASQEERLAIYTKRNIKEKNGYEFNEYDSFQFKNENGQVKVIVSDFLILDYLDLPQSWWEKVIEIYLHQPKRLDE